MSVFKAYWGQGVGSLLLDTLLDVGAATQRGCYEKSTYAFGADNHRAVALYERKGFVVEGRLTKEMFVDGRYYDLLAMGRGV